MLKDQLWDWVQKVEVVSRLTLTYLVRQPEQIAVKRKRDRGVEYWLDRWHRDGSLAKHAVYPFVAYYIPTGKPGIRGNLAHDLLAGLAAAKLYAELRGVVPIALSRQTLDGLLPDWLLEVGLAGGLRYYLEFHSKHNKRRNLLSKIAAYTHRLGENDWLLIVTQSPTFVDLPSEQMMLTSFADHLAAANSWTSPIWYWGGHDGRHSLLSS